MTRHTPLSKRIFSAKNQPHLYNKAHAALIDGKITLHLYQDKHTSNCQNGVIRRCRRNKTLVSDKHTRKCHLSFFCTYKNAMPLVIYKHMPNSPRAFLGKKSFTCIKTSTRLTTICHFLRGEKQRPFLYQRQVHA